MDSGDNADVPLVVDLDGTLIKSDLLLESVLEMCRRLPWMLALLPWWLLRGRAHLKHQLAERVSVPADSLPYRPEVLSRIEAERGAGRRLVLATASDERMARGVADHVGAFQEIVASDGTRNLKGAAKRDALVQRFGVRGFDYVGNEAADLPVWAASRRAIVVSRSARLAERAARVAPQAERLALQPTSWTTWLTAVRVRQWPKNLLVFAALVTSHRVNDPHSIAAAVGAFVAFCLASSAAYVINDLLDLHADRLHATKRHRPIAAGAIALGPAIGAAALLLLGALACAAAINGDLAALAGAYLLVAIAYSVALKRIAVVDVVVIAALFTLRVFAGAAAIEVPVSSWLTAFGTLMFLSVALSKRYAEILASEAHTAERLPRRGYRGSHRGLVVVIGIAAGLGACAVLAAYSQGKEALLLYSHPGWLVAPALLFAAWVLHIWNATRKGRLREDPLSFALSDPLSYLVGSMALATVWAAT